MREEQEADMRITLHRGDYEKILKAAVSNLPEEACGLIAGREEKEPETEAAETGGKPTAEAEGSRQDQLVRHIEKVYLLTNVDHSNEHFTMDPGEQLKAVKDMRARGLKPLGNWHSHP